MKTIQIYITLVLLLFTVSSGAFESDTPCGFSITDEVLCEKSVLNIGNMSAIKSVLRKAEAGKDIVVGAVGGSITMGALASEPAKRYINLTSRWFAERYPDIKVRLFNAGIGATDSKFGAFRLNKHLLQYKPDIVIVEYSINDSANDIAEETFEGIIRQLIINENKPAVIILAMMNAYGKNVEEKHLPIAGHYQIPMVSLRAVFEPLLNAGAVEPNSLLADSVHPNDTGHKISARLITLLLERAAGSLTKKEKPCDTLPEPLYSDNFQNVEFFEAGQIKVLNSNGWLLKSHSKSAEQPWRLHGRLLFEKVWHTNTPASSLSFEYDSSFLALTYWKEKADMGIVKVYIDGTEYAVLDGWGPQQWGGYAETDIIGRTLPSGKHSVRIVLTSRKNRESRGNNFELLAVGVGD